METCDCPCNCDLPSQNRLKVEDLLREVSVLKRQLRIQRAATSADPDTQRAIALLLDSGLVDVADRLASL